MASAPSSMQCVRSLRTGNLAGLQAASADVHLLLAAVDNDGNVLDVRLELTVDGTVRVADGAPSYSVLTADLTDLRHFFDLPWAAQVRPDWHSFLNIPQA